MAVIMATNLQEIEVLKELELLESKTECVDCDQINSKLELKKKMLNIIHFNIRSIQKNFNELLVFLQAFNFSYCDIIILSECWQLSNDIQYNINGYNMYYNQANINKNDGVAIFIKSNINANIRHSKLIKSGVTLSKICFELNNISFGITCGYRPPSTNVQYFLEDLEEYFSHNLCKQVELFIGDININTNIKDDNNVNLYLSILNFFGFELTINGPTRITPNSNSCLDHIFIRNKLKTNLLKHNSFILKGDLTDHFPVMINLFCDNVSQEEVKYISKKSKKINYQTFQELISNENWVTVLNINDVETATKTSQK